MRSPAPRTRLGTLPILTLLLGLCAGCPPAGNLLAVPSPNAGPETEDIVPVGGYEVLAGLWTTTRQEGQRERTLRLQITVEDHRLRGAAPPVSEGDSEHAVRIDCQVQQRTCLGTWFDNDGRGNMTWRFGTDFASFTGFYEGERRGNAVGKPRWVGTLQQR